ncbi:PAS domain-containing protein [Tychonema sp. BBK16]|uniref:PAS domain-containing protein n=1 Tax=Tychonema sp. BBK16 TaxID=2699888 RepID=UPI001F2648C5|nr:PAS domain-containing protein [Tychonema sp. BBK16]MCF6371809.1 PAS domain-containing protein [Tychonema sp. BBK16]
MTSVFQSTLKPPYLNLLLVEECAEDAELIQNILLESKLNKLIYLTHILRLREAIENLVGQVFDVILLDISLPNSQRFDNFLSLQNYGINIPIVILTAADDEALAIELIAAGAQDYLVKGQLDSRLLIRTLQCAIVRHKWQAEGQKNTDKILTKEQLESSKSFFNYTISVEEAMLASEARFRSLVENIPAAIYRCQYDVHWKMEFISDEIEAISGYSATEFMCKSSFCLSDIIHATDTEMIDRKIKAAIVSKQPYYLEYRIICADGATRWISERGRPAYNLEGQILWIDGVMFDITDRKQAELTLQQVTQAVDSASDAIAIANLEGYSIYHNLAFIQRYGYTVEELNNSGGPAVVYTKYQELRKLFIVLRKGLSWSGDIQLKAKNGEIIETQLRADCIKDSNNQPIGMMVIIADLTELKRTESALKLSQERLQLALFGSSLGLWDWNIATGETYFDSQWKAMLGYEENEIENTVKSWGNLLHPEDKLTVMAVLKLHIEGNTSVYEVEFRMLNKSGNWQWIMALGKVVEYDEWGEPLRMNGTHQDISDRKQTELALQESEARERSKALELEVAINKLRMTQSQLVQNEKMVSLGQLVAGVAHEINNPISFIHGNLAPARNYTLNLLALIKIYQYHYPIPPAGVLDKIEEIDLDYVAEDLPKLFNSMRVGTDRIVEIVKSLRNFSRLDESAGKSVNIHEGIDSTLMILQNRLKSHSSRPGIQVIKDYQQLPNVECFPGQLNQVFMNILINAIDALEERDTQREIEECDRHPSTITIRTYPAAGGFVAVSIADNGRGIQESVTFRMFDPFFTTKPVGKGTGLGLSISHSIIVDRHRGKLSCISTVGKGSEFLVEIPVHQNLTHMSLT